MNSKPTANLLQNERKIHIRGDSLILARWSALVGQTVALLVTYYALELQVPLLPSFFWIILSGIVNNYAVIRHRHRGMTSSEATLYLCFDVVQLTALLYLTGGLSNPFCVLMMAPVVIGATLLPRNNVFFLIGLSLICTLYISIYYTPLPVHNAEETPSHSMFLAGEALSLSITLLFMAAYTWRISAENRAMQKASHAAQMALLRQQQLHALGAQAAAAAHELGSPLSTLFIVAKELESDMGPNTPYSKDIQLLVSQTERCRTILKKFGEKLRHDQDYLTSPVPADDFIRTIAEPFLIEKPSLTLQTNIRNRKEDGSVQHLPRTPEMIHGIGVYLQNAIQFAKTTVTITIEHRATSFFLSIHDDGPGFSPQILTRLGEPFISTRMDTGKNMGLGIFIAQTLLEDTGASLSYDNKLSGGALISLEWTYKALEKSSRITKASPS
jgi:two-component system sensor histidine kinase RegB